MRRASLEEVPGQLPPKRRSARRLSSDAYDRDYVEKLIGALEHREPLTRVRAAWLLGKIGDPRAVRPLMESLSTHPDDPDYLATAAEALGLLGDQVAVPALIDLTHTSFLKPRLMAVEALGRWRSNSNVRKALATAQRDRNEIVRAAATRALSGRSSDVPGSAGEYASHQPAQEETMP